METGDRKGECDNFLSSLLNLKQGNAGKLNELINKAVEASTNMAGGFESVASERLGIKGGMPVNASIKEWETGRNSLNRAEHNINSDRGREQLFSLLSEVKRAAGDNRRDKGCERVGSDVLSENEEGGKGEADREVNDETEVRKAKKLISGKCTKPDESDIKQVVRFPHEKLDVKHVQDRVFDKLSFNLLVAGELEIALIAPEPERSARIGVAKTICYHKHYLRDEDLRNGYDSVLKKVEQGILGWDCDLGEELHELYDYRANVLMREKVKESNYNKDSSGGFRVSTGDRVDKLDIDRNKEVVFEDLDRNKPVFCMEYNRNCCSQDGSHEGSFSGRKCIKWHICRRCRRFGELKNHPEQSDECPQRI